MSTAQFELKLEVVKLGKDHTGGKEGGFDSGVAGQKYLNQVPLKIHLDSSLATYVPSCLFMPTVRRVS